MTKEELKENREAKAKNKFKSRTFWITIFWAALVPISVIAQIFIKEFEVPIATIASFAGSVSLVYIGGNKVGNVAETMKLDIQSKTVG